VTCRHWQGDEVRGKRGLRRSDYAKMSFQAEHGSDCWVRYGSNSADLNEGKKADKGKDCDYLGSGDYSPEKTALSQCLASAVQRRSNARSLGFRTRSLGWYKRLPAPMKRPSRPNPIRQPNPSRRGSLKASEAGRVGAQWRVNS
jgi:hypothetical protein